MPRGYFLFFSEGKGFKISWVVKLTQTMDESRGEKH